MGLKRRIIILWGKIRSYPKKYTIPGGITAVFMLLYGIIFFIDKPVMFSYAGPTCTNYLTLLPDMQKASSGDYRVTPTQPLKIGTITVAARAVCFTPIQPPREGVAHVSLALGGGWLMRKAFALTVTTPPTAQVAVLDKPIPLSRPLTLPLSDTDKIFTYHVKVANTQVSCNSKNKAASCEVKKLGLLQGKPYTLELIRQFDGKDIGKVIKKDITTLAAVHVSDSSVKSDETVYAKPKTFDFVFDKEVSKVKPTITRVEGETRTLVASMQSLTGKRLQLIIPEDLPRSANYEITLNAVEASDGSGLEAPYKLTFKTSGGPKVSGVNIGKSGVATGSTAVVTFDQPLLETQDVSKFVTVTGGAVLSGKKDNQLFVSLAGVPKCGDFSIKLTNDLQSNYEIAGNSAWSFASRISCHTVSTIGYSSKGRAINAYSFGDGPAAVLYTGAIHGNEVSTKSLMNSWINDLEANARSIPAGKTVVVVPQINPDGVASGARVNGHNIDLNRNFATGDWQKDITTVNNQPFPGGGGDAPMSEPETQAIATFASRLRPILVLSYHSQGSVVVANETGMSTALAGTYSQLSGYRNATGQSSTTFEYSISGTADDWYAQKLGAASVVIELGSHSNPQFSRNQKAMWAMLNNS